MIDIEYPWVDADPKHGVATWNVYHGTPVEQLQPVLTELRLRKVSKLYMTEAGGKDITRMLKAQGYSSIATDHQRFAWLDEAWSVIQTGMARLTDEFWFRPGETAPVYCDAAGALLVDVEGRVDENWTFHLPPHTQFPEGNRAERRFLTTVGALQGLTWLADESTADAFTAAGDANWDTSKGYQDPKVSAYLLSNPTLRQLSSDAPTYGDRSIDVFLVKRGDRQRPVANSAWTMPGGGAERPAHKVHGRTMRWIG